MRYTEDIDMKDLEDFLEQECDVDFYHLLDSILMEKAKEEIYDNDIYNAVDMDRRVFNKFRSDRSHTYKFSKRNILRLCIALHLDEEEATLLLKSAGYSFDNSPFDQIVRYCLQKGIYNYYKINEMLHRITNDCFE